MNRGSEGQAGRVPGLQVRPHDSGPHRQDLVSDLQPAILVGSTSFDDFRYVDAIISRDVLVPYAPRDAEAKSWMIGRGEGAASVPGGALEAGKSGALGRGLELKPFYYL